MELDGWFYSFVFLGNGYYLWRRDLRSEKPPELLNKSRWEKPAHLNAYKGKLIAFEGSKLHLLNLDGGYEKYSSPWDGPVLVVKKSGAPEKIYVSHRNHLFRFDVDNSPSGHLQLGDECDKRRGESVYSFP